MSNAFDDLFNEFFRRKKTDRNEKISTIQDEIKKIIDTLMGVKIVQNDEMLMNMIQNNLGEPTRIEEFNNGKTHVKKLIWETPFGQFVKIIMDENDSEPKPKEKSLEEQLIEAVESENYELAIKLRDEIKANKKTKRTKKEKKS
jgi:excinuclease UvrABC helicase subunit UvrB